MLICHLYDEVSIHIFCPFSRLVVAFLIVEFLVYFD